jgi:glycosyltransferase involved in cell wall biosynthesis
MLLRRLDRTRFVLDHHDLCPELFQSRFGGTTSLPYKGLRFLERTTHRTADHVTSTNDSYRRIAITRSGKANHDVTVVRTGPDPDKLRRGAADESLRRGHRYLVTYIGVMGPQDGLDLFVRMAREMTDRLPTQIRFVAVGDGSERERAHALAMSLGLGDDISFPGRLADAEVRTVLSTADVCVGPDPQNGFNELCTMNKTLEYMAMGVPVVSFDLAETRVSAGDAAVYAQPNDPADLARCALEILAEPDRGAWRGRLGEERVAGALSWANSVTALRRAYELALAARGDR